MKREEWWIQSLIKVWVKLIEYVTFYKAKKDMHAPALQKLYGLLVLNHQSLAHSHSYIFDGIFKRG